MGKISKDEREQILLNCSAKLKTYIDKIKTLNEDSLMILIILLGQYLFARYSIYGKFDGVNYTVYVSDVTDNISSNKFTDLILLVVKLRNLIAHNYGSNTMMVNIGLVRSEQELLNEFLKYLLEDSSDIASGFLNACDM